MPGRRVSMPKRAAPVAFSVVSMRLTSWPISLNWSGVLIAGSAASATLAASAASSPKVAERPEASWRTTPLLATQAAASTPHLAAAAAMSRARADAPACCRNTRERRTEEEPPVPID